VSLIAPYTPITTWPESVNGTPAISRYTLLSLDGSVLVTPSIQLAYKPIEELRLGLGVNALVGSFATTVDFSASPNDHLISAP
ncbi:hypothetical protein ACI4CU_28345, partial [Klebsiella pneumoniae]|uniref:hypothetical protein n=1 Tax=Klebsiella pneumoniae TaxID=573 RepID=UPI003854013E